MYNTLVHNFNSLSRKIKHLRPHSRERRGLINILGTGLKYLTGTMDHDDETEIKNKLDALTINNKNLIEESNKQILINNEISDQIKNLTKQIKIQQNTISKYLNNFTKQNENRLIQVEDEIEYIQQIYQINYDIDILKNHISDIEQILLTSKLGVLSRNILTEKELTLIDDLEKFADIKTVVVFHEGKIVIILLIPEFSEKPVSKILIEPMPDKNDKSIYLENYSILVDYKNDIYYINPKDNLKKNLIKRDDKCIENIIKFKEANCVMKNYSKEEIKEILPGMIITKNIVKTNLSQTCNNYNISIFGNNLIRFENCRIKIKDLVFENFYTKIRDNIILPHFITKVVENKTLNFIELEDIHVKNIVNNRKKITEIENKTYTDKFVNISTDIIIITIILGIILGRKFYKRRKIIKIVKDTSSEPQANGGGVTVPITPNVI